MQKADKAVPEANTALNSLQPGTKEAATHPPPPTKTRPEAIVRQSYVNTLAARVQLIEMLMGKETGVKFAPGSGPTGSGSRPSNPEGNTPEAHVAEKSKESESVVKLEVPEVSLSPFVAKWRNARLAPAVGVAANGAGAGDADKEETEAVTEDAKLAKEEEAARAILANILQEHQAAGAKLEETKEGQAAGAKLEAPKLEETKATKDVADAAKEANSEEAKDGEQRGQYDTTGAGHASDQNKGEEGQATVTILKVVIDLENPVASVVTFIQQNEALVSVVDVTQIELPAAIETALERMLTITKTEDITKQHKDMLKRSKLLVFSLGACRKRSQI